ncbi:MAG: hypothetical protein N4A54_01720 [Peptostreptococcaceae bacterium]|jgi:hypothetical protein|nr:hypothetical protein [Peptostreptococcaceae bacterium]
MTKSNITKDIIFYLKEINPNKIHFYPHITNLLFIVCLYSLDKYNTNYNLTSTSNYDSLSVLLLYLLSFAFIISNVVYISSNTKQKLG